MGQVVDIMSELVACGEALSTSNAAHLGREQLWAAIARARAIVAIAPFLLPLPLPPKVPLNARAGRLFVHVYVQVTRPPAEAARTDARQGHTSAARTCVPLGRRTW